MFIIIKQSHILLIKYLNRHVEQILSEKHSITIRAINSWNKGQLYFSNLSLKTYNPIKIRNLLSKTCIENYNEEVELNRSKIL